MPLALHAVRAKVYIWMHVTVTVMLRTVTVTNELYFKATVPFYVTYLRSTVTLRTVTVTNKNLRERFALLRDPT